MGENCIPQDETTETTAVIYTHGHSDAVLRSHRWRTAANSAAYLLPHLSAEMSFLDIGCGPGTLTVDLARHVRSDLMVGVDLDAGVVLEATGHAQERGIPVTFRVDDLGTMERTGEGFDVVHAHQVLQHVGDPVASLQAMARLAKPGGLIAARDASYPAMHWWPELPGLDRWLDLYNKVTIRNGGTPDAGQRMLHWGHKAGLSDVRYSSSTWTYATPSERAWWSSLWRDRVTSSRLGESALVYGLATRDDLHEIGEAWTTWASHDDAIFVVVHGELLARP